jgi:hypothetical protein
MTRLARDRPNQGYGVWTERRHGKTAAVGRADT